MKSANAFICKFLLAAVLISSCKKEVNSPTTTPVEIPSASNNANVESKCRLTYLNWPGAGIWQFHYNEKGLADQWTIDYGFGSPLHTNVMTYDDQNRMIQSKEVYFGLNYVYDFFYSGNRLTRLTRSSVEFPNEVQDFLFTYNSKGDVIRQDDALNDTHVLMSYDAMGNCLRTDVYLGTNPYYSDNYTFEQSARNPELNIPGVTVGFIFYGGTIISNKRWFSSNRTVVYSNGIPFTINDYDAAQTEISAGEHHFPITANYHDLISDAPINITFEYENCNGSSNSVSSLVRSSNSLQASKSGLPASAMPIRNSKLLLGEGIHKINQN